MYFVEGGMVAEKDGRIVLVTCESMRQARQIANTVVEKRLAACVNILGGAMQSIYCWKGSVETAKELLIVIKTTTRRLNELEKEVKRLHSYDVPEFVVLPIVAGSKEYLRWLQGSVKA
jgi:periplasmic divalent cation tolerance protein